MIQYILMLNKYSIHYYLNNLLFSSNKKEHSFSPNKDLSSVIHKIKHFNSQRNLLGRNECFLIRNVLDLY